MDVSKFPISPIRTVNRTHYLSGVVGLATNKTLVEGGLRAELIQIFHLIGALLRQHNSEISAIFKTTVYIANEQDGDFEVLNEVYYDVFGKKSEFPVRTTVGADRLPMKAKVQIEVEADAHPNRPSHAEEHPKHAREDRRSRR